jgi:hypothetical protein
MAEQQAVQSESQEDISTNASDEFLDDVILDIEDYKTTKTFGGPRSVTEGIDDLEEESEEDEPKKESESAEPKEAKKEEKPKGDGEEAENSTIRHMRKTIDGLKKQVKALEAKGEEPAEKKEPEVQLTDQQLLAIMQEHEGEPEVMLNIMKYIQQQGAKEASKTAEVTQKVSKMTEQADAYLSGVFDGYNSEEFRDELDTHFPLEDWGLKGNPLARQIQAGLALASAFKQVVHHEVEKVSKGANKGKIEEKRQEAISLRGGLPKTDKTKTVDVLEGRAGKVVKDLNLNPRQQKLYATFLGGSKKGK